MNWQNKISEYYFFGSVCVFHIVVLIISLNWPGLPDHLDSHQIYNLALSGDIFKAQADFGKKVLAGFCYPFAKLGISYNILSILFSIFSLAGYYLIYLCIRTKFTLDFLSRFCVIILFCLPSIHFWTSYISKDAAMLFLIGLFMYASLKNQRLLLFSSLILIGLIRPHITLILLVVWLLNYFFDSKRNHKISKSTFLFVIILGTLLSGLFYFIFLSKLPDVFSWYKSPFEFHKNLGSSMINVPETLWLQRFLYMMYRPLFYDTGQNFFKILQSAENTILLLLTLFFLWCSRKRFYSGKIFLWCGLAIWAFTAIYIYNYGLASRMKVIILPFILIGIILSSKKKLYG